MISAIIHNLANQNAAAMADWPHCPGCQRPLASFQRRDSINERFKLNTREIYGYCPKCGSMQIELATPVFAGAGSEHEESKENWRIIRFRFFVLRPLAWQKVNELPVPLAAVGPAREFDAKFFTTENIEKTDLINA